MYQKGAIAFKTVPVKFNGFLRLGKSFGCLNILYLPLMALAWLINLCLIVNLMGLGWSIL